MRKNVRHMIAVALGTFLLSLAMNFGSTTALRYLTLVPSAVLLVTIILIGIIFDIIGVAATAASEAPFHAMAVDKVPGSAHAIWLVRNADKVATFCNDVVGDISGTLSGAVGAAIVFALRQAELGLSQSLLTTLVVALAAAATVGGKAFGKSIAINRSEQIIHSVARLLFSIETVTGLKLVRVGNNRAKRRKYRKRGNA